MPAIERVPLLIYVPGAPPKRVQHAKRSHIDLAPTILELMGVAAPAGALRGTSLLADVVAPQRTEPDDRDVYFDMPTGPFNEMRRGLITGTPGLKLIDFGDRRYALFDLESDPLEERSISGDGDRLRLALQRMQRLRSQLQEVAAVP